jgi:hypothetical protein
MASTCWQLRACSEVILLFSQGTAPVDARKQLRGGDPRRTRELGDGSNARLALAALDLCDMGHVEVGAVRQAFLAQMALLPDAPQVGGEDVERVGHRPTMLGHLSQLC